MGAPNRLTIDTVAHVGRSAALLILGLMAKMCDLFDHEVEVPGEVIRQFVGANSAMLALVGFQA